MMIYRDCKVQSFFYIAIQHLTGQKGVVSLRGNSFFKRKKHSGYENPNASGKM